MCVVLEQRANKGYGENKQVIHGLALDIAQTNNPEHPTTVKWFGGTGPGNVW